MISAKAACRPAMLSIASSPSDSAVQSRLTRPISMGVVGERLHHGLVELPGLVGPEKLSHGKYVRECCLLQLAHDGVAMIDCGGDSSPVAVLGLDRLRQSRVVGTQLKLVSAPLHRKPLFQDQQARLLIWVERQLVM